MEEEKRTVHAEEVRKRAARKFARISVRNVTIQEIRGDLVQPVHLSKADPIVRRITKQDSEP